MKLPTDPRAWLPFAGYVLGGLAVLGLLWAAFHFLIFLPRENATNKAKAIVQEETTQATGKAAGAALEVTREVHTEHIRIERIVTENEHAIKTTPGAETRAPAVAATLNRSLCLQRAYLSDPGCAPVLGNDDGLGPAERDGRSTPAR